MSGTELSKLGRNGVTCKELCATKNFSEIKKKDIKRGR